MKEHGFLAPKIQFLFGRRSVFLRSCYLRDGLISAAQSSSPRSKFAIVTKKADQLLKSWRETFNIKNPAAAVEEINK